MKLFAYGTLMDPEIMCRVAGAERPGTAAVLHGYRRRRIVDEDYPGIVAATGDAVDGVLYPDITRSMLERLDVFEGELYERRRVYVWVAGMLSEAHVYVLRPAFTSVMSEDPWSLETFARDGRARFVDAYLGLDELQDMACHPG